MITIWSTYVAKNQLSNLQTNKNSPLTHNVNNSCKRSGPFIFGLLVTINLLNNSLSDYLPPVKYLF